MNSSPTTSLSRQAQIQLDVDLVLGELTTSLRAVDVSQLEAMLDAVLGANRVFLVGVGRVMLSLKAFAKRLNHLGISAHCVGDINEPPISSGDLLIVGSGSGESVVPVAIARVARRLGASVLHVGSNPESSMAAVAHLFVRVPAPTRLARPDELESRQIMTTLFEQTLAAIGDVIALAIVRERHLENATIMRAHANLE